MVESGTGRDAVKDAILAEFNALVANCENVKKIKDAPFAVY